jgi:predicted RNA-binding protein Jag
VEFLHPLLLCQKAGDIMPTLTQLKTWLTTEYPPASIITDAVFVSRVNDIQDELYVILGNKLSNDYKLYDTDVTVANQQEYTLPTDCTIDNVKLLQVRDISDTTLYNTFKYFGIASGIPSSGRYYTKGEKGKYLLYEDGKAITTADLPIKIYYYNSPAILSENTMSAVPDLDVKYHNLIKYKSAQKAAASINDTNMANYWESEYQEFLKRVIDDLDIKVYVAGEVNNQIIEEW